MRIAFASCLLAGAGTALLIACAAQPATPPDELSGQNEQNEKRPKVTTSSSSSSSSGDTKTVQEADASVPDAQAACVTVAPNNRCGLDPQCGCGSNETCDVTNVSTGATSCVSGGSATLGRPCTQTGDCMAGLTCEYGACRPYCKTARSKCGVAGTDLCVEVNNAGKPIPNRTVCTIDCDPRNPSAVCGTNACHWFATYYAPAKVTDCNFPGNVQPYGAVCNGDSACTAGHVCIDHPSTQIGFECERWCRMGVAGDCPASPPNLKCVNALGANAPVIGGQTLGVCQD